MSSRRAWLLAWLGGPLIGIANGTLRELAYKDRVGELTAHQLSTGSAHRAVRRLLRAARAPAAAGLDARGARGRRRLARADGRVRVRLRPLRRAHVMGASCSPTMTCAGAACGRSSSRGSWSARPWSGRAAAVRRKPRRAAEEAGCRDARVGLGSRVMSLHATLTRAPSRHQPRLCPLCRGPIGRQEDACWRCGARVRHVHCSGRHTRRCDSSAGAQPRRAPATRRARGPSGQAGGSAAEPSGGPRPPAGRTPRRQAAPGAAPARARRGDRAGDVAYRRLCDRLDDFDARLAAVRRTLSTTPAARPVAHTAKDRTEAFVVDRSCLRATHGCRTYRPCGSI